jgi:hypothetical protein
MCVETYVSSPIFRHIKPFADISDIFHVQFCKIQEFTRFHVVYFVSCVSNHSTLHASMITANLCRGPHVTCFLLYELFIWIWKCQWSERKRNYDITKQTRAVLWDMPGGFVCGYNAQCLLPKLWLPLGPKLFCVTFFFVMLCTKHNNITFIIVCQQ